MHNLCYSTRHSTGVETFFHSLRAFSKGDTCNLGVAYLPISSNKIISNCRCCSLQTWKGNRTFGLISCLSQTKREEAYPNYLQKLVNQNK